MAAKDAEIVKAIYDTPHKRGMLRGRSNARRPCRRAKSNDAFGTRGAETTHRIDGNPQQIAPRIQSDQHRIRLGASRVFEAVAVGRGLAHQRNRSTAPQDIEVTDLAASDTGTGASPTDVKDVDPDGGRISPLHPSPGQSPWPGRNLATVPNGYSDPTRTSATDKTPLRNCRTELAMYSISAGECDT